MSEMGAIDDLAERRAAKAEYARRATERHKRRLMKSIKETELPPFPGGIDDLPLGE